jgi:hypothetical protein
MDIQIIKESEELVVIESEYEGTYRVECDIFTGDWLVFYDDNPRKQAWLKTKEDGIKFSLEQMGVIDDANYERASDRTSA